MSRAYHDRSVVHSAPHCMRTLLLLLFTVFCQAGMGVWERMWCAEATPCCLCRGVLPPEAVATVHTFGAPAVFCEGAAHATPSGGPCSSCSLPCSRRASQAAEEVAAAAAARAHNHSGLLERLGLHDDVITNIVMSRDIVPRAFVCDYTMVADMLKYWSHSFKEHVGLAACKPHKVSETNGVFVCSICLQCGHKYAEALEMGYSM